MLNIFSSCSRLTKVKVMRKEPPTITSSIFSNVSHVYVPYGSKAKYEAAQYWKDFNIRMDGDSNGDDTVTMADANAIVNYFLAKGTDGFVEGDFDEEAADVNGDGEVTMADANQIVNMFLSGGQ